MKRTLNPGYKSICGQSPLTKDVVDAGNDNTPRGDQPAHD